MLKENEPMLLDYAEYYFPSEGDDDIMIDVRLTEDQVNWIINEIRVTKENEYTGDDFQDAMEDWNPENSGLHPEELEFLQSLFDAVRPE